MTIISNGLIASRQSGRFFIHQRSHLSEQTDRTDALKYSDKKVKKVL
jgi:hypothetical protein